MRDEGLDLKNPDRDPEFRKRGRIQFHELPIEQQWQYAMRLKGQVGGLAHEPVSGRFESSAAGSQIDACFLHNHCLAFQFVKFLCLLLPFPEPFPGPSERLFEEDVLLCELLPLSRRLPWRA